MARQPRIISAELPGTVVIGANAFEKVMDLGGITTSGPGGILVVSGLFRAIPEAATTIVTVSVKSSLDDFGADAIGPPRQGILAPGLPFVTIPFGGVINVGPEVAGLTLRLMVIFQDSAGGNPVEVAMMSCLVA